MLPVNFPGANICLQKNTDPNAVKTPADELLDGVPAFFGVDANKMYFYIIGWRPSYEDIEAISAGCPIFLKCYCQVMAPVGLFTVNPISGVLNSNV